MGDGLFFHEIDASGTLPNEQGIRYVPGTFIAADGTALELEVTGYELRGRNGGPLGSLYQRQQLIGASFELASDTGKLFKVRIAAVDEMPFWVNPVHEPTPTYTFEYQKQGQGQNSAPAFTPVCTSRDLSDEWRDRSGTTRTLAVVFTGDRYNPGNKTVNVGASSWFNVACAGSAMAKMELLRHTTAGIAGTANGTLTTTPEERQAMLKMLTDDICGTGYSFTVDGHAVFYMDRKGWHPFAPSSAGTLEAIWSKDGAICVDEPRLWREDPTVAGMITAECQKSQPRPTCRSMNLDLTNWTTAPGAYGVSANPP